MKATTRSRTFAYGEAQAPAVGVVLGDEAHLDGRAADAAQLPAGEHPSARRVDKRSIVGASRKANVGARKLSSLGTADFAHGHCSSDATVADATAI